MIVSVFGVIFLGTLLAIVGSESPFFPAKFKTSDDRSSAKLALGIGMGVEINSKIVLCVDGYC